MRFFTIETIKINNPAIKTNAAIGIVKNINQGRAAQPQFPSFASGPQKITERKAPAINGKMASNGASAIASRPVFTLQTLRASFLFMEKLPHQNKFAIAKMDFFVFEN